MIFATISSSDARASDCFGKNIFINLYKCIKDTTLWYITELRIANRTSREVELVHLNSIARASASSAPNPFIFETRFVPISDG